MTNIIDFNTARRQDAPVTYAVEASDIRDRLNASAESFVQWMYSGRAFISKNKAVIGDVHGTPGGSLTIQLSGPNAGLWKDHATDEGGDLIALYRAWSGYHGAADFNQSLKEIAKDFLGDPVEIERTPWQVSPNDRIAEKKAKLGTELRKEYAELGAPVATYKYFDTRGNVIASVVRHEPDGTRASKTFRPWCFKTVEGVTRWQPGCPDIRPLFRLPEISIASHVVLVEGEGKAEALAACGIEATSAMLGAMAPIEKTDWTPLAGKTVTIWPDNDAPGFAYAKDVAAKLTALGCKVLGVTIPAGKPTKWDAADCIAEGGDPAKLVANATQVQDDKSGLFKLYSLEELEHLPAPKWLLGGMLVENSIALLWAGSDSFKTFLAIDIAMSIATGFDWHGRPVTAGHVVYIAAEDETGVKMRMIGWRDTRGKGLPKAKLSIMRDGFTLATSDADKLILSIAELQERPRLIVIDTLARTFGAGNENATQDMNAFVLSADKLRRATGATVLIIHHTGRNAEQERGNVALRGACDTIISIKRASGSQAITLINTPPKGKQKNAEPFKDIELRMQPAFYQYGGAEVSTLIVMADDARDDAVQEDADETPKAAGEIQQQIMTALKNAAKTNRRVMGTMALRSLLGCNPGTLSKALSALVEKGLLDEQEESAGPNRVRKVYAAI